jgi:hypothetical protein
MTAMGFIVLVSGLAVGGVASAAPQLATDDSPPADIVLYPVPRTPPSTASPPAKEHLLDNRFTVTPAFGMIWLEVLGDGGSGMAIQPTVTRTFDRVELQGALTLADWRDGSGTPHGALFERLGGSAGYQVGRIRVERTMTMDLVLEAGAGIQRIERDEGGSITRGDLSFGLGLRTVTDLRDGQRTGKPRIFLGMEAMIRLLVMPSADARPDKALLLVFGSPVGR